METLKIIGFWILMYFITRILIIIVGGIFYILG